MAGMGSVLEVCGKCMGSMREGCGKCVGEVWEARYFARSHVWFRPRNPLLSSEPRRTSFPSFRYILP